MAVNPKYCNFQKTVREYQVIALYLELVYENRLKEFEVVIISTNHLELLDSHMPPLTLVSPAGYCIPRRWLTHLISSPLSPSLAYSIARFQSYKNTVVHRMGVK